MPFPVLVLGAEVSPAYSEQRTDDRIHAGRSKDAPVNEEALSRVWYGWQLLPGDGAAAVTFCVGLALLDGNRSVGRPLMTVGELVFLANGPVVHGIHDHAMKSVASLGMRVLFPLGGHALGVISASRPVDTVGVIGAGLVASAVDIVFLAFDEPDPPRWARWVPSLVVAKDATNRSAPTLTFSGAF